MILQNDGSSRRKFLADVSLIGASTLLPSKLWPQSHTASAPPETRAAIPNRDTVLKFRPDGTPRPFAGNTVICHLPVQCAMRDAMVDLHEAFKRSSFRHKLGLTSTDSYHMTVFPGANDQDRTSTGWPSYVPVNAAIDVCSEIVGARMAAARLKYQLPLSVRVDVKTTIHYPVACTLRLVAASPAEEVKLRSLRDQLSEVYGFRLASHASYGFHMGMAYQLAPFTPEEQSSYTNLLQIHVPKISAAAPVLQLGEPEYCTFLDMFRFEPKHLLFCAS